MMPNLDIFKIFMQASSVVQFVMILLIFISVASWTVIIRYIIEFRRVKSLNSVFERVFWSGSSINDLYTASTIDDLSSHGPTEALFCSGMQEYLVMSKNQITDPTTINESVRGAMRASHYRAIVKLECNLSFLASVGSVSPYLGLFGAIWGFMHAFNGLDAVFQVTLGVVGPAIVESLSATALGLLVSIPAVIAYNQFANDIYSITISQEIFIEDFSKILLRNLSPQVIDTSAS